jgi:hypothetical protein
MVADAEEAVGQGVVAVGLEVAIGVSRHAARQYDD